MNQHIKKKHQKGELTLYRHPSYLWMWFGKTDDKIVCYTSRIIPAYSNRYTITDTPQLELKGSIEITGQRIIITQHKGEKYRIPFKEGYEEAKAYKSNRTLRKKRRPRKTETKRPHNARPESFLETILSFNTDEPCDPLIDGDYELFDFPLPSFYEQENETIDYTKIKQMPSGIWTIVTNKGYVGGYDTPLQAYKKYLGKSH